MNKKWKAALIVIVTLAAALLCIVCVATVVLGRQYLPFLMPEQAAPQLMPADTTVFASMNPNVQSLAGYKHLAEIYGDIPEVKDALDDFSKEMKDELGISFEDDVMPWLGSEVAIAVADIKTLIEGDDPSVAIAAPTRNTKASDAFLEKLREYLEDQDYDVEEETYEGVTYHVHEVKHDWEIPLAFGTVKRFVVLTTDENLMEDIIDVAQGKADALATNERYTELVAALPDDAIAYLFFDMQEVVEASLQAWGLSLDLDEEGIQLDFAVRFDPNVLPEETLANLERKASAHRVLKRIPNDALGFISGQNLAAGWESFLAIMKKTPDFEEQLNAFENELGLRIDEDTFGWLSGEFALAIVETGGMEDVPVGGFVIFEIDDQREAEDAFEDIVDAVEKLAFLEFTEETINDVEMQVLIDPYTEEIILGYGFTDAHLVIGFMEGALEVAVDDDLLPITDDETFKKMQKHLPSQVGGYSYVNVEAIWRLAYESMSDWGREDFDEMVRPFLEPIKAIGAAAPPTDPKKGIGLGTLFIYIPGE